MISELGSFIFSIIQSAWSMLNSSSSWMVFSFAVAGVLHEFLKPEKIQKTAIGSKRISGVFWTTLSGMFIPICSCGTIPLGISMYYSGAYLGPTLAFMTSTPMINPLAVILAWGLLGKEITIIYIITGFVAPMIIGIVANHFAGNELHIGLRNKNNEEAEGTISLETDEEEEPAMIQLEFEEPSVWEKLKSGLRWSFTELSVTISKYTVSGMLIAGFLFTVVPQSFVQDYLGNPGMISLLGITVVAALMYVCAVGHIPFIAALVASGAAPGVAITFLMAGAGTNIPELLTISKTIGKRAMFMYFSMVVVISNLVGYLTNRLLMPGFNPVLDFDRTSHTIQQANKLIIALPDWGEWICSGILVAYAAYALLKAIRSKMKKA
ncbi:efflux transporter SaoE [Bariatricus sp. HCP28S3_D3]|uniref:efflux transporter SaoE n=1 Tax=Bariatricus sp. HCP28S3_D3 TaxID=3438901 RepID=UPI003EFF3721